MNTSCDVVIASVPWTDTEGPLMAPAVLKSVLTPLGVSSVALDLNQEVRLKIINDPRLSKFVEFFTTQNTTEDTIADIIGLFNHMVERILRYQPKWICLSLLTYLSQNSCQWLCFLLKQRAPNVKIVIGGPGCFNSLKGVDTFVTNLKKHQLIDHYISGDGERSLPALLQGNLAYPGIDTNSWQELDNLDQLPMPDYTDYNFDLYPIKMLGILGSRGCVRNCTFCDVHEHWNKFQWRSAQSIFNEMMHQYYNYGISIFLFSDSLVNGNQKEFRELTKLLADFNQTHDIKIRWTGFFIFRPKDQMREDDWKLIAESGALKLIVGVESFVDHIRYHLKKKFSNVDLEYGLEMANKYNVALQLLLIVGYVTETDKDHQESLEWVRNHRHYQKAIQTVNVGSTLAILPGTWLHANQKNLNIRINSTEVFQDWTRKEINSTPEIRMARHQELVNELKINGYNVVVEQDNHVLIESYIKNHHE